MKHLSPKFVNGKLIYINALFAAVLIVSLAVMGYEDIGQHKLVHVLEPTTWDIWHGLAVILILIFGLEHIALYKRGGVDVARTAKDLKSAVEDDLTHHTHKPKDIAE